MKQGNLDLSVQVQRSLRRTFIRKMLRSIITGSSRSIIQQSPRTILRRSFMKPSYAALNKKPDRVESELTHPALLKDPPIANPSSETDPWSLTPPSLPPVPEGLESMTIEEIIASPHPEGRDNELTEVLRKRLIYESRKRGILETDLILATFAKERIGTMVDRELREYDRVRSLSLFFFSPFRWQTDSDQGTVT
jgi:hypothetical protein